MGAPSVGDVDIIAFPYSDLSQSKRRPALVLAGVGRSDFLLCQITSKEYGDSHALSLKESDKYRRREPRPSSLPRFMPASDLERSKA